MTPRGCGVFPFLKKVNLKKIIDAFFWINDRVYNTNKNAKFDQNDELYIKTWVREIQEIPKELERIKIIIEQCNINYIEKMKKDELSIQKSENNLTDSLNDELEKILASLSYD